ncbi:MAG: discoidin domain-containing protein, partial [Spirochaetota bacterium]
SRALYRCLATWGDHFVSHDPNCEGQIKEGRLGYLLQKDPNDGRHVPLHRCMAGDHFVSQTANCEGYTRGFLFGYAVAVNKISDEPMVNVAKGKTATQSSLFHNGFASKAVDGNTDGHAGYGNSVTHTNLDYQPWWMVDLRADHAVEGVTISNRIDCCSERLRDIRISYLNSAGSVITSKDYKNVPEIILLKANNVRKVKIQIIGRSEYLSLAEVQVWKKSITRNRFNRVFDAYPLSRPAQVTARLRATLRYLISSAETIGILAGIIVAINDIQSQNYEVAQVVQQHLNEHAALLEASTRGEVGEQQVIVHANQLMHHLTNETNYSEAALMELHNQLRQQFPQDHHQAVANGFLVNNQDVTHYNESARTISDAVAALRDLFQRNGRRQGAFQLGRANQLFVALEHQALIFSGFNMTANTVLSARDLSRYYNTLRSINELVEAIRFALRDNYPTDYSAADIQRLTGSLAAGANSVLANNAEILNLTLDLEELARREADHYMNMDDVSQGYYVEEQP